MHFGSLKWPQVDVLSTLFVFALSNLYIARSCPSVSRLFSMLFWSSNTMLENSCASNNTPAFSLQKIKGQKPFPSISDSYVTVIQDTLPERVVWKELHSHSHSFMIVVFLGFPSWSLRHVLAAMENAMVIAEQYNLKNKMLISCSIWHTNLRIRISYLIPD